MLKYCPCCKEEKDTMLFNNNKTTKDKLYAYCKECSKIKNKFFTEQEMIEIGIKYIKPKYDKFIIDQND